MKESRCVEGFNAISKEELTAQRCFFPRARKARRDPQSACTVGGLLVEPYSPVAGEVSVRVLPSEGEIPRWSEMVHEAGRSIDTTSQGWADSTGTCEGGAEDTGTDPCIGTMVFRVVGGKDEVYLLGGRHIPPSSDR